MEETLLYISYIGIILLIGLLSSILSKKLKIPNLLLLIGVGMAASYLEGIGLITLPFSPFFLTAIAIITLAMVVFDSSSKFNFRTFDSLSLSALRLSTIFLVLNMVVLSALTYYIFKPAAFLLALLFAAAVSGTDPSSTMMLLTGTKSKLFELLKVEAVLNTPLVVLIPFLIIDIMQNAQGTTIEILRNNIGPFAQQFVVGIGAGILIAFIFFRFMKKYYSDTLSPLALITAALLTYVLSESLGGNGVLGVTTAGLFFGNVYRVKHKQKLQEFGEIFSEVFEILVFVLIGTMIKISWTSNFLIPASILFLAYLIIRFLSVQIAFSISDFTLKEKIYMTLNMPKGIAVAVVAFTLATKAVVGMDPILDLIFLFMIYSLVLSTILTRFSGFFTKMKIKVGKE